MKKLLLLLFTSFILCSCDNDDDKPAINPVDQLPPATQIGANKVGCLLDGVAFLPDNSPNSTNCFYQFVNGEYYFILNFNNSNNNNFKAITLGTEKLSISINQTLNLSERIEGSAFGTYTNEINDYTTDNIYTGELIITRLSNQIVSGTFWFDVVDNNGIVHQIREGRFDMQYTN